MNSESGNFVIPVHAYPVMDRQELREIFSKTIDFGTVDMGESNLIVLSLFNK